MNSKFLVFLFVRITLKKTAILFCIKFEGPPTPFVVLADLKTIVLSTLSKYEGKAQLTGPLGSVSDVSGAGCGCFCCKSFSMVSSSLCTAASMSVNNIVASLIFPWKTSFAEVLTLSSLLRLSFEESRL